MLLASLRKADAVAFEPLDMGMIVQETLTRFGDRFTETDANLIVPESWPVAMGYAPWVEEIWVNYISNALKYGGTPPRIELGAEERADNRVRFWVQDNGSGLTSEAQAKLFTEFTRLEKVRAKGHGLGLSIVLRIVTKLGGEVGVESEVGIGSRFWFELPKVMSKKAGKK